MFHVDFGQTAGEDPLRLGPYESVEIQGESMLASPVRLRFDAEGEPPRFFGPFSHYSMADGIAYVDRRFFASYSEKSGRWHCVELPQDCTGFAVVSAA